MPRSRQGAAFVYKDGATWRWECRRCSRSERTWRHSEAMREAEDHLRRHADFGFRPSH